METIQPKYLTDLKRIVERYNLTPHVNPYQFINRIDILISRVYIYSNGKYRIYLITDPNQQITSVKTQRYDCDMSVGKGFVREEEVKVVSPIILRKKPRITITHTINGKSQDYYHLATKPGEEHNIISYKDSRKNYWDKDMDIEFPYDNPYDAFTNILTDFLYGEPPIRPDYKELTQEEELDLLRIIHSDIQWVLRA